MIVKEDTSDLDRTYNYMDGEIVLGYLEIRVIDEIIDIMNVYTDPENRSKGIATSLFNYMFEHESYTRVMLEVNEKNNEAIKLYNKLGFKEISIRERYYGEDPAIIMEKVK